MFFSEEEKKVISKFCSNIGNFKKDDILLLVWSNVSIRARFEFYYDDEDDDNGEAFWSFGFVAAESGKQIPTGAINDGETFTINYHNFPNEILLNEEKIN